TADGSVAIERDAGLSARFAKRSVTAVLEKQILDRVIGDDDIKIEIAIKIGEGDSERLCQRPVAGGMANVQPGGLADVFETPVSEVAEQSRKSSFEALRSSVGRLVDVPQTEVACEIFLARPLNVIAHEQVESSIVVVIEPSATRAPVVAFARDTRFAGHIDEPTAVVAEQAVGADRRKIDIGVTVVVVVADGA